MVAAERVWRKFNEKNDVGKDEEYSSDLESNEDNWMDTEEEEEEDEEGEGKRMMKVE